MKRIINILKTGNYTEDNKREIDDFGTLRITDEYLKQLSKDRLASDRAVARLDLQFKLILIVLDLIIVYLLSLLISVHYGHILGVLIGVVGIILIAINLKNK